MRILILAPRFPWPLDRGDRLTIYKYVEYFFNRGHQVHLLTFAEPREEVDLNKISGFCEDIAVIRKSRVESVVHCLAGLSARRPLQISYYRSNAMRAEVARLVNGHSFDILYAHTIRMADYLKDVNHPGKVLAMQVSMALTFRRMMENSVNPVKKVFAALEYLLVRDYEAELTKKFAFCCLISKTDSGELEKRCRATNVFLNPHGVDHHQFTFSGDQEQREKHTLIFSGNMGYAPNVDAITYFVKKIFPLVLDEIPGCKLLIVGRRPSAPVRRLAEHPNIEVTGEVPDMGACLRRAAVGINPMRVGSGLQNKLIESLASGLPVVASTIANEGIGAVSGKDLFLADTPREFSRKVVQLLNDRQLCRELAVNGREFIERQYTWEYFLRQLEQKMLSLNAG